MLLRTFLQPINNKLNINKKKIYIQSLMNFSKLFVCCLLKEFGVFSIYVVDLSPPNVMHLEHT